MMIHWQERILAAGWFGLFGFLIVPFIHFSYDLSLSLFLVSIGLSVGGIGYGYLYGYKSFLDPADQINPFILRMTAAVWSGCLAGMMVAALIDSIYPSLQVTATKEISILVFIAAGCVIGFIFGHRLLSLPQITYTQSMPSKKQRLFSMLWFGGLGSLLQAIFLHGVINNPNSLFMIMLAIYLGFTYGYRFLLLPKSLKALLKAIMLGWIGSSFALAIFIILYTAPMVMVPTNTNLTFVINSTIDTLFGTVSIACMLFLTLTVFICIPTVVFSLLFYGINLLQRRK